MTNDRGIQRLNYQWQASIHFSSPMVGQYDVIFYEHYKKLTNLEDKKQLSVSHLSVDHPSSIEPSWYRSLQALDKLFKMNHLVGCCPYHPIRREAKVKKIIKMSRNN